MSDQHPTYPSYPGDDPHGHATGSPTPGLPQGPAGPVAPAGYVAPPTPLGALTGWAIALAAAMTAVYVVSAVLAFDAQEQWLRAADNGRSAEDVWTPYDVASIALFPVGVALFIVTCMLLYRARTNLDTLSPGSPHARSRGWTWGGWLVPVVNLWFPYQVVRDVLRQRTHHTVSGALLGWWWAAWLVSFLPSMVESAFVPVDDIDTDLVTLVAPAATVGAVVMAVACLLWVLVLRALAADQRRLFAEAAQR